MFLGLYTTEGVGAAGSDGRDALAARWVASFRTGEGGGGGGSRCGCAFYVIENNGDTLEIASGMLQIKQ